MSSTDPNRIASSASEAIDLIVANSEPTPTHAEVAVAAHVVRQLSEHGPGTEALTPTLVTTAIELGLWACPADIREQSTDRALRAAYTRGVLDGLRIAFWANRHVDASPKPSPVAEALAGLNDLLTHDQTRNN